MAAGHAPEVKDGGVGRVAPDGGVEETARSEGTGEPRVRHSWPRGRSPLSAMRPIVFLLCLGPFLALVLDAFGGGLGVEPIQEITHRTGWWALTLLMVTLAVTPIRRLTGWNRVIQLRRMLGLFAFFYACLHVLTYFALDQFFALDYILEDIAERPYITIGFTAWVLMIPLAVTSTRGWVRRLGTRWQRLHRLVYVSAALGVLHFLWQVKADVREPLIFAAVLVVLLALRGVPLPRRGGGRGRPSREREAARRGDSDERTGSPAARG